MKRDKLGDLLLTTPMLQLLKKLHPKSELAVVAPESSAWILKNAPFIDQLYCYPQHKFFNLKSIASIFIQLFIFLKIRLKHYDIAIAAGGEFSPRAIKRLSWINAKRTISFVPKNKAIKGITDPVIEPSHKKKGRHESQRMIKLLDPIIKSKKQINQPKLNYSNYYI